MHLPRGDRWNCNPWCQGIKLDSGGPGTQPEMIVLCHHNEGRVLLTDEDGMYNDFILEACRAAGDISDQPLELVRFLDSTGVLVLLRRVC